MATQVDLFDRNDLSPVADDLQYSAAASLAHDCESLVLAPVNCNLLHLELSRGGVRDLPRGLTGHCSGAC